MLGEVGGTYRVSADRYIKQTAGKYRHGSLGESLEGQELRAKAKATGKQGQQSRQSAEGAREESAHTRSRDKENKNEKHSQHQFLLKEPLDLSMRRSGNYSKEWQRKLKTEERGSHQAGGVNNSRN